MYLCIVLAQSVCQLSDFFLQKCALGSRFYRGNPTCKQALLRHFVTDYSATERCSEISPRVTSQFPPSRMTHFVNTLEC